MGVAQIYCIVLLVVIGYVNAAPFAKKSEGAKVKRPFCNAFTGCGRKRSDPSFKNLPIDDEQEDDGMTDDWNQFDSNYPGAYRTQDGQRRYGFFPGIFRKKRSEQTVKSSSS